MSKLILMTALVMAASLAAAADEPAVPSAGWIDQDGDGRHDLFQDGDGRNDITGLAYERGDLHGDRFGFVRESAAWVDEDGDGFPDAAVGPGRQGREDRFLDRDGDGMADGCWFQDGGFQHHRANTGQGRTGQGGQGGQGGGSSGGSGPGRVW